MQMYSGKVDYNIIAKVKKAVDIPVIANGDIVDEQSAAIMFEKTNCDAIMIGRGALGNPWIFRRINAYLNECRVLPDVSINEKMVVMLKHIQKIIEYKGEYTAMREARHHAAYYTKGIRGGAALRKEISTFEHFEQLEELAYKIAKERIMIFKNCTFFNENFEKEFGDIEVENGIIKQIGIIDGDGKDMAGTILIPGFVDVHIHGCAGGDASDADKAGLEKMANELAKHGVTSFCPTSMTLPQKRLEKIVETISEYKSENHKGSKIAGINLEGPYIAMGKKGCAKR